jgi:flagellar basal body rod protein FlgG
MDPVTFAAFARIERRAEEVRHAYDPAFRPADTELRRREGPQVYPDVDPLATAPPKGAFFVVTDGAGKRAYTQDGGFRFEGGALRASNGASVLGFRPGQNAASPLAVSAVDVALGRVHSPRIDPDGSFTCALRSLDPGTGRTIERRVLVGRIALASFPAASEPGDGPFVRAPAGVAPAIGRPMDGGFGGLHVHVRQGGDVDLEAGLERLREAYASLDALQAAHKATGDAEKTATELLK